MHASSGNRHFWGLFTEANKDITFYIVNPVANKQQNQAKAMNLKTLYTQAVSEFFPDSDEELNDYLLWDVSNVLYFTDLTPALKALDLKLQEYKQKFKGAALAVL